MEMNREILEKLKTWSLQKRKRMCWNIRKSVISFKDQPELNEQMEKVLIYLEAMDVDVLRIQTNADDDLLLMMMRYDMDDEEEVELERSIFLCRKVSASKIRFVCI